MTDKVEQILKNLLQKSITVTVKGKTVKKGKLIIFRTIGCFVRLEILNGTKQEHVEMPFPFQVSNNPQSTEYFFDYRLETLADGDEIMLATLRSQVQIKESKYYDRVLTISVNNES